MRNGHLKTFLRPDFSRRAFNDQGRGIPPKKYGLLYLLNLIFEKEQTSPSDEWQAQARLSKPPPSIVTDSYGEARPGNLYTNSDYTSRQGCFLRFTSKQMRLILLCMLGLHYKTPPEWAAKVLENPADLLLDHFFAEMKAASMALRTLKVYGKRYPALKELMEDLAKEEYEHAETVRTILKKDYKWPTAPRGGSKYVRGLRQMADGRGHGQFLDMLLVCSLVEARSAERFKLLADYTRGTSFGRFYEDFFASEVGHYVLFVKLGCEMVGQEATMTRLEEFRAEEARLITAMPVGPQIHSSVLVAPANPGPVQSVPEATDSS